MLTLQEIACAFGGDVSGQQVLALGPGHSAKDRNMSVWMGGEGRYGFTVESHAGDGWAECQDFVRLKLGLGEWKPSGSNG